MDRQVKFYAREIVPSGDLMDAQHYTRQFLDDLVAATINGGQAFAGFAVTKVDAFNVGVAPGLYFSAGRVYAQRTALAQSLAAMQPLVNRVVIGVVAYGQEVDGEPEYRNVVVNVDTRATEAQLLMTQNARLAQIAFVKGVESADPQPPNVPLDRLLVATITLSPTGVESIDMIDAARQPAVAELVARARALEGWRAQAEPRISTIGSDVANLANGMRGMADAGSLFRIAADVARLKDLSGLPDTYADYGADRYLNNDESAVDDLEYHARVEEGVRFPWANQNVSALQVFNALNPLISQAGGVLLPAFQSKLRFAVTEYAGEQSLSQYTQSEHTLVQKTMSRTRIRFGQSMGVCTNSRWWASGRYDPATGIFTRSNGETWQVAEGDRARARINHQGMRVTQFWVDNWTEPYWDMITTTTAVAGALAWQSFLNTQAGWLTGVDLYFTKRGPAGDVHVAICEVTESGTPNLTKTIYKGSIAYLDIKTYPATTTLGITPTYLEAGKRYALVAISNGDHYIGLASGGAYLAGTSGYSTDGQYFAGDLTKDWLFGLRYADFGANSRVVVDLQPLNLDGGITDIDILAGMITPDATSITFELQVNGAWRPVAETSRDLLVGLPPLLPLRAVFQGTPDIHAGIRLLDSQVKVSRPSTALNHIATPRLLPLATQTVRIVLQLGNWTEARHTCSVQLKTAGGRINASLVEDQPLDGVKRIQRMARFALPAAISEFQIVINGASTTALDLFLVEERVDIEF